MVIYFPRYNTECSNENWTLGGIFRVVSRFPLHFVLYRGNLDYLWDSVAAVGPMAWWWLYCVDRILGAMGTASWIMANSLIVFFFFREREGRREAGRKWNSRIRDSQKLGNEKMHEKLYREPGSSWLIGSKWLKKQNQRCSGFHKVQDWQGEDPGKTNNQSIIVIKLSLQNLSSETYCKPEDTEFNSNKVPKNTEIRIFTKSASTRSKIHKVVLTNTSKDLESCIK